MHPLDIGREFTRGHVPDDKVRGLSETELDHAIDAWYANQYDDEIHFHDDK